MRRILIVAVSAGALAQAGAASAGCMATVGLAPPPAGIAPGTWTAELTVLQHRRNASQREYRPAHAHDRQHGDERQEDVRGARNEADPEVFVARVVFPTAGSWRYEVYDDFSSDGASWSRARRRTPSRPSRSAGPPAAARLPARSRWHPCRPRPRRTTRASRSGRSWAAPSLPWRRSHSRRHCSGARSPGGNPSHRPIRPGNGRREARGTVRAATERRAPPHPGGSGVLPGLRRASLSPSR